MMRELVSVRVASKGFGRALDSAVLSTFVVLNQWIFAMSFLKVLMNKLKWGRR